MGMFNLCAIGIDSCQFGLQSRNPTKIVLGPPLPFPERRLKLDITSDFRKAPKQQTHIR